MFFTTLAGTAQGLIVLLAIAVLSGVALGNGFLLMAVGLAEALLIAGLTASFLRLGRKMRAWRAVLMWRTSWMSREVIVLPAFIALVGVWWLLLKTSSNLIQPWVLPVILMGMSAGAFNTREFFHGATQALLKNVKLSFIVLAFAVPSLLLLWGVSIQQAWLFLMAFSVQAPGLIAERWFFFAQAKHPQNLYYQTVS